MIIDDKCRNAPTNDAEQLDADAARKQGQADRHGLVPNVPWRWLDGNDWSFMREAE